MADSSEQQTSRQTSRQWPLRWAAGGVGAIAVLLVAAIVVVVGNSSAPEPEPPAEPPTANTPTSEAPAPAAPADDLRARQQQVSAVLQDLDREVLIGGSPTRGNPDASVVLMEFSDFQCSFCARAVPEVKSFVDGNEADVLFVYKHLPLMQIHPEAVPAALASWAAQQQGEFWAYHDALFANQDRLGEDLYVELADTLGLDVEQFNRDRASTDAQAAIARDLALAAELQLNSTPTFLMGDLLIPGAVPADFFAEALARLQAFQQRDSTETGE